MFDTIYDILRSIVSQTSSTIRASVVSNTTPFGAIHAERLYPIFQVDGVYSANSGILRSTTSGTGSVTASDSLLVASTGTTALSQGVIQSRKRLRYRPGQGVVARFTAKFSAPIASSYLVAGVGHAEDGVFFGYKDTDFGIIYSNRGVRETRTLTVTVASSTAENITVTLNGVNFTVPVTNSGNINRTAYEIASFTYAGWAAQALGATVVFLAGSVGSLNNAYSIAGATAAGTFARTKAGAATTEQFIAKTAWNGDKLDGTGASGVTIDPTKLNVFQIKIQYLGAGPIVFQVEVVDENNNIEFVTVHTLRFPNSLTTSSFGNPSFPLTLAAYSAGSTTNISVSSASFAGFVEGDKVLQGNRFSYFNSSTGVSSAAYVPLFTVANALTYGSRSNQSIINILDISAAVRHVSPASLFLIKNGTLTGNPVFSSYSNISCSLYDTAATGVTFSTNEQLVWSGTMGETGQIFFQFDDEITLQPGETLTLAGRTNSGNANFFSASLNTREDQ
jgi:hypothetical protein